MVNWHHFHGAATRVAAQAMAFQVIAHGNVLYNFAIFQAKSVNVLNFERFRSRANSVPLGAE
jgi:hypothetical protein